MESRVYTVAGAKGGVGKTTSSINVGASLAEKGYSTVVVELDLAMANLVDFLDIDIDVTEATTLHDVLAGSASVEPATYQTESGLWVLPSGTNLRGYADTDLKRLPDVVETLREEFDVVLLDTPAGLSEETVRPMQLADEVLLVSTPRVASVRNARNTQDLAERVGVPVRGLVLTKSGTGASPGAERIASFLATELLGHVPEDEAVPHSQDSGYPVVTNAPNSGAAIAYQRITEKLVESNAQRTDESKAAAPDRSSESADSTSDERLAEQIAAVGDSQATQPPETESESTLDEEQSENPLAEESEPTDSQSDESAPDEAEATEPQSDESAPDEGEAADPQSEDSATDESEATESESDDSGTDGIVATDSESDDPATEEGEAADPQSDDGGDGQTTVLNIDPALATEASATETGSQGDTQQPAPPQGDGSQEESQSESPEAETVQSKEQSTTTEVGDESTADSEATEHPPQAADESSESTAESEEAAADGGLEASSVSTSAAKVSQTATQTGVQSDTEASGVSTDEVEKTQPDEESQTDSGGSSESILGRVLSLFF